MGELLGLHWKQQCGLKDWALGWDTEMGSTPGPAWIYPARAQFTLKIPFVPLGWGKAPGPPSSCISEGFNAIKYWLLVQKYLELLTFSSPKEKVARNDSAKLLKWKLTDQGREWGGDPNSHTSRPPISLSFLEILLKTLLKQVFIADKSPWD